MLDKKLYREDVAAWFEPLITQLTDELGEIASELTGLRSRLESAERNGFHSGVLAALAVLSDSGRAITNEYEEVVGACGPVGDLFAAARRLDVLDTSGMTLYVSQHPQSEVPSSVR